MPLHDVIRFLLALDRDSRARAINSIISANHLDAYPSDDPESPLVCDANEVAPEVRAWPLEWRKWIVDRVSPSIYFEVWLERELTDHADRNSLLKAYHAEIDRQIDGLPDEPHDHAGIGYSEAWATIADSQPPPWLRHTDGG